MKKNITILSVLGIFLAMLITVHACKKEQTNQNPTCTIINPQNGQQIKRGDTVTISVEALDPDGTISEVQFYIDEIGKISIGTFPYNYDWNTLNESISQHTIRAKAIDNSGGTTSDEIDIIIISDTASFPIAAFTASLQNGLAPFSVQFTDMSSANTISWQWDFGDGNTSIEQNPSHIYYDEGTYTVALTAINIFGSNTETKSGYIHVFNESIQSTFTDPRDGQTYNTLIVGEQEFFAENLNYDTVNSWCYNDNNSNCIEYGRLYAWSVAKSSCPAGWHLPDDDEWKLLEMFMGMSQSEADNAGWRGTEEGKKLKYPNGWYDNGNGTDVVGFSALPAGIRNHLGNFGQLEYEGSWWSATEYTSTDVWTRTLGFDMDQVYRGTKNKTDAISIRCVRD